MNIIEPRNNILEDDIYALTNTVQNFELNKDGKIYFITVAENGVPSKLSDVKNFRRDNEPFV